MTDDHTITRDYPHADRRWGLLRASAPLWDWRRGQLAVVGRALRLETTRHDARHRIDGRRGLLVSAMAAGLWDRQAPCRPSTLYVVEGLTDWIALSRVMPLDAVIGVPGSLPLDSLRLWRHVSRRPSEAIILAQPDEAGERIALRAEQALWQLGIYRVAVAHPKRGMDVAEGIAWARDEGRDPLEASGVRRGHRALRSRGVA